MTDPFTYASATYQAAMRTGNRHRGPVEGGAAGPMPSPHHVPFDARRIKAGFVLTTIAQMLGCLLFLAGINGLILLMGGVL